MKCSCGGALYVASNAKSITLLMCVRCGRQQMLNSKTASPPRVRVKGTVKKKTPITATEVWVRPRPAPAVAPTRKKLPPATPIRHKLGPEKRTR